MTDETFWKTKLLAFIHDPAEKALVLLRGAGHETGTIARLKADLFEDEPESSLSMMEQTVKQADRWAAGADRLPLPKDYGGKVVFAKDPMFIHPLTGESISGTSFEEISVESIENLSFEHFQRLIIKEHGHVNWKKTFLAFWRFGPELNSEELRSLWKQLPADTRTPDHTIWEHLCLTSALAGSMASEAGGGPALLLVSLGPVQEFIAQARTITDLWAGSHLLSSLCWEAMKLICDELGPDSILFPQLHGAALVDLWLKGLIGQGSGLDFLVLQKEKSDSNPLFAASFPNRFLALVPYGLADTLMSQVETHVRKWAKEKAVEALEELQSIAAIASAGDARATLERQIKGFPEIYWSVVPWSLGGTKDLKDEPVQELLGTLGAERYYLPKGVAKILANKITFGGVTFYDPNPGIAYAGLYEALERLHGCAKAIRPFEQTVEAGYKCSLCGEREWLATVKGDPDQKTGIFAPPQKRGDTIWTLASVQKPSIAKEGEHLCGICTLKRLWARLFVKECEKIIGTGKLRRFVLSTHALALSTSIWNFVTRKCQEPSDVLKDEGKENGLKAKLMETMAGIQDLEEVALPKKLYTKLRQTFPDENEISFIKKLPAILDRIETEKEREHARSLIKNYLKTSPETYYALILMDGDNMGAWLSGKGFRVKLRSRFHDVALKFFDSTTELEAYLDCPRWVSPAYHQEISTALNSFSVHLAPLIVEELFMGKLIYVGGDDLLAMVAVHDLPQLMFALRCAYSGTIPKGIGHDEFWERLGTDTSRILLHKGFALIRERKDSDFYRLMGTKASVSMGAVVVHHQAPLGAVLRELRRAEKVAKSTPDKDAFAISFIRRSGGAEYFVGKWALDKGWDQSDMGLLLDLREAFGLYLSRRSAYIISELLKGLPPEREVLKASLNYQFRRQSKFPNNVSERLATRLAERTKQAVKLPGTPSDWQPETYWLRGLFLAAEFLAREGRISKEGSEGQNE